MCMMSVHREKISKNKQRFIDRFRRDPRRLQLLFLGDAGKSFLQSYNQGEGNRAISPPKFFKNMFSCQVQHQATIILARPKNISWVRSCLLGEIKL